MMNIETQAVDQLASSPPGGDFLAAFLAEKSSEATRRAYASDLKDFFGSEPQPNQVAEFLALPDSVLALRLFSYKADLLGRGVAEATINRRLSVLRSLLKYAHGLGVASCDGRGLIEGEKLPRGREPKLLDAQALRRLIAAPARRTVRGLRDMAILRLLCENGLRRSELCALDVADFSPAQRTLRVSAGMDAVESKAVPLSRATTTALCAYLETAGHHGEPDAPLFRNLDHRPDVAGERLTPDGLHFLVRQYGEAIGQEQLTPRQLRESAVAAALAGEFGDLRRVLSQRSALSRLLSLPSSRRSSGDEGVSG
jgi:integrase/recombinase XerC